MTEDAGVRAPAAPLRLGPGGEPLPLRLGPGGEPLGARIHRLRAARRL